MSVKITATRSGEEVAMKLNMKAAEMHAAKQFDPKQVATAKPEVLSAEETSVPHKDAPAEPSVNTKNNNETAMSELEFERWAKQSRMDKLSDAGNSGISKPDQAHVSSFFDKVSGTRSMPDQQTTLPPVRFSLPDNITSALKTNVRSVMISIEPDNLGPAKLHLAMHNDALTARLTVESVHAKAAVESSLDQLTDQLARAGVKVHHVEVSVSGGDVGSNMFERRPIWNAKPRPSTQSIDRLFDLSTESPTPPSSYRSPGYVRADSVNVFA
jgi:flagellar hook-length control protein FliK